MPLGKVPRGLLYKLALGAQRKKKKAFVFAVDLL